MTSLKTELSTIGELVKAATLGPWHAPKDYDDGHDIDSPQGRVVGNYDYEEGGVIKQVDRDFIIAARTDVPKLLAVIDTLIKQRNHLRALGSTEEELDAELITILTATDSKGEPCKSLYPS